MIIDYNGPTLLQIKTVLYSYPINERIKITHLKFGLSADKLAPVDSLKDFTILMC